MDRKPDIEQASSNLSNVCGVLAGFAATLVVLLLTPGIFSPATISTQDVIMAILVMAAALYINSAAIFGNVPRVNTKERIFAYNFALIMFLSANILFAYSLNLLLTALSFSISAIVSKVFLGLSIVVLLINFIGYPFLKFFKRLIYKWAKNRKTQN